MAFQGRGSSWVLSACWQLCGVLKWRFGYRKVRYKRLAKNTAQLHTLFALVNLYLARKQFMAMES